MGEPLTLSEAITELTKLGYSESFRVQNGVLYAMSSKQNFAPEKLVIDRVFRYEGETDLDEEVIIFALSCPSTGLKGTYITNYGPMMGPEDSEIVLKLDKKLK